MRVQQYYSNIMTKSHGRRGGPTFAEAQRDFTQAVRLASHIASGF
ncbi:MAG: hypothetical protein O3B31_13720 [Chloroflexi bacterium]|nr:hypothetical protein [Chloroflexota bacterium]MDA1004380.1 hypothetical protein [Chloroflexota bacterium]